MRRSDDHGNPNSKFGWEVDHIMPVSLGGDQQLGFLIREGEVDVIIFFWDPMEPLPHDVDVKALLRIAELCNVPTACNRSTADFMISSPLFKAASPPILTDYSQYTHRSVKL